MKIQSLIFAGLSVLALSNCTSDQGNERLGEASEKVGTSAATVVKKVKSGIEKVSKINLEISEALKNKGLSNGKIDLGSQGGHHNKLSVYMIFDKNFNRTVSLKVKDSNGIEIGRTKKLIKGTAGDAQYIEFVFDKHTNIDRDHSILME